MLIFLELFVFLTVEDKMDEKIKKLLRIIRFFDGGG